MHHLMHFRVLPRALIFLSILLFFAASQVFWIAKLRQWKEKLVKRKSLRRAFDAAGAVIYAFLFYEAFLSVRHTPSPTRLTLAAVLVQGPFEWWIFGSLVGFGIYLAVKGCGLLTRAGLLAFQGLRKPALAKESPESGKSTLQNGSRALSNPDRRLFFERTATLLGAVPFVAGAYGVFVGRLNLETTRQRIALPHLPRGFDGFTILQLSDLHIGPFMTAREIRKIVDISNRLRPDLVALTGDFVTWDSSTQYAVVDALSGLKAPHGVWGCLGNHEIYTHTESSITRLFAARGVRILRQQQALIAVQRDFINLIGVDFQSHLSFGHHHAGEVRTYLEGVERLVKPGAVNILMSHNPNTFDRAAALGIDLSLAGHTHGGQVALEFVDVDISPARLITPYVRGWFRKGRGQLYVNRGIGTIAFPIRLGSPPEITVYQLTRSA